MSKPKKNEQVVVDQVETTQSEETKAIGHNYNELHEKFGSKSAMIRFLDSEGHKRGTIAKFMGIKYQFVRNVLITPIKKQSAA